MLDISDKVAFVDSSELGLTGFEFDPDFDQNRYVYVKYTVMVGGRESDRKKQRSNFVLSRFQAFPSTFQLDPRSERVLFDIARPGYQHAGSPPVFDENGLMYVSFGDGINGGSPPISNHPSRDLTQLRGKILRIDTRDSAALPNNSTGPLYSIPPHNPFASQAGKRGEVRKKCQLWGGGGGGG